MTEQADDRWPKINGKYLTWVLDPKDDQAKKVIREIEARGDYWTSDGNLYARLEDECLGREWPRGA